MDGLLTKNQKKTKIVELRDNIISFIFNIPLDEENIDNPIIKPKINKLNAELTDIYNASIQTGLLPTNKFIESFISQYSKNEINNLDYTNLVMLNYLIKKKNLRRTNSNITCANCSKEWNLNFKRCSNCNKTQYCSKMCQAADWKSHKKICAEMKAVAEAEAEAVAVAEAEAVADVPHIFSVNASEVHGQGKVSYSDGTVYEGDFKNGLLNGQGKMTRTNGTVYEGNFKNWKPHGQGKMTRPDDSVYEGNFENGMPHGQGKIRQRDEYVYEGNFENGKPHGQGKITFPDDVYEGIFKNGLLVEENGLPVEENGLPVEENGLPVEENGLPVEENGLPVEENGKVKKGGRKKTRKLKRRSHNKISRNKRSRRR